MSSREALSVKFCKPIYVTLELAYAKLKFGMSSRIHGVPILRFLSHIPEIGLVNLESQLKEMPDMRHYPIYNKIFSALLAKGYNLAWKFYKYTAKF